MAEYIEREATCKGCVRYGMGETLCADCVVKVAPAADVAPVVHGRWEIIEIGYGVKAYECSECKDDDYWQYHFAHGEERYCPNCGAKMTEE